MSAPAGARQTMVVTAVPRGYVAPGTVEVGALVSPRLSYTAQTGAVLGDFADLDGWPEQQVSWEVSFDGGAYGPATPVSERDPGRLWHEIFGSATRVDSFDGDPGPARTALGYTYATLADGITQAYAAADPASSALVQACRGPLVPQAQPAPTNDVAQAVRQFLGFWEPVGDPSPTRGELAPDLHERLTLLSDHPRLLEALGLVVRLQVAPPAASAVSTVRVRLVWAPSSGVTTVQVNPPTRVTSAPGLFAPALRTDDGAHDARLRLALDDAERFSVHSVDVDATTAQVVSVAQGQGGATIPSARSGGLTLAWRGRVQSLQRRLDDGRAGALTARSTPGSPPTLFAEDLVVGHHLQVGVVDEAAGGQPVRWFGLGHRATTYTTTSASLAVVDEAPVAMVARRRDPAQATTLLVSDVVARWDGWSLAVPHPAQQLLQADPADPGVEHEPGSPGPDYGSLDFATSLPESAADGTDPRLPALRFGRRYCFRGRAVDVTGGAPAWDDAPATAPVPYLRWEAAASPLVLPPPTLTRTEDAGRLVVRSDPNSQLAPGPSSSRVLVPPRVSVALGLLHGVFDRADGTPDPSRYTLLTTLDAAEPPERTGEPEADGTPAPLTVGWLPDPMTTDVHLGIEGLPEREASFVPGPDPLGTALVGHWSGVGLELAALPPGSTSTSGLAGSSPDRRRIRIGLRPGARARVEVRSLPREARILQHGVLALRPGNASAKRAAMARGDVPTVAPARVVELVHAVKQPLLPPAISAVVARRAAGEQNPVIAATVRLHDETAGRVTLTAAWDELVDEGKHLRGPGWSLPTRVAVDRTALLDTDVAPVATPAQAPSVPLRPHDYEQPLVLPDLRRRDVTLSVSTTSRFVEEFREALDLTFTRVPAGTGPRYLDRPADVDLESIVLTTPAPAPPPGPAPAPAPIPRRLAPGVDYDVAVHPTTKRRTVRLAHGVTSLPDVAGVRGRVVATGPTATVIVPSAVRPAPPELVHALPAWASDEGALDAHGIAAASRGPGRLRLWLERPWWTSGVGERLAVVTGHSRESGVDFTQDTGRLSQVVSLYGLDPTLRVGATPLARTAGVLTGTVVKDVVLSESLGVDGQVLATIAAHDVAYHPGRDLYVAEVAFPGKPPGTFVRLAVARYQPHVADGVPQLSPVVTLDPVQLLPARTVRVRNRDGLLEARVSGTVHLGEDKTHHPQVRLSLQRHARPEAGDDLGWETVRSAVVTATDDGYPPVLVSRGGAPARGHRVLVEEIEPWLLPGGAKSPAYTRVPASARAAVDDLAGERITWVATTPLPKN
ncbi:hypothetical protein GCM10023340_24210 [Nocardioides marinquilinus]|uniref:Baseplate protein J-like domain-containing protein n=1 Tax=Nocardioides marinquilinus TaxID=1210400 RepID=A0ABP9PMX6_9ACTN